MNVRSMALLRSLKPLDGPGTRRLGETNREGPFGRLNSPRERPSLTGIIQLIPRFFAILCVTLQPLAIPSMSAKVGLASCLSSDFRMDRPNFWELDVAGSNPVAPTDIS